MRCYLDTNILVFFIFDPEQLSADVRETLYDYSTLLYTSTVCVMELIHLAQTGKICTKRKNEIDPSGILDQLKEADIRIEPVNEYHLETLSTLPLVKDHRDPNDRMIIAQAISDRIPIVSSDGKFTDYIPAGLEFIYNER